MSALKTQPTDASVTKFLSGIKDDMRREDCFTVLEIMREITKSEPTLWGTSIVGFGSYHYKYESGREGDWFLVGFSPRKADLTLYLMHPPSPSSELFKALGKHKGGKACLYIKRLDDIHLPTLKKLIRESVKISKSLSKSKGA